MPQPQTPELSVVAIDAAPIGHATRRAGAGGVAGPGWFDSSWDLQQGLEVKEAWFGDEPLHGWIEGFLAAQRSAAGRTASPRSSTAIA